MYLLTDIARAHYWLGEKGFLPIAAAADYPDAVPGFLNAAAAEARVQALRRRGHHLRVMPLEKSSLPVPNGKAANGLDRWPPSDLGLVTTFTYSNDHPVASVPPPPRRARPAASRRRAKRKRRTLAAR